MRLHTFLLISTLLFPLQLQALETTESYTTNGVTYHRPAVIKTAELTDFDRLPESRRKLITAALDTARNNTWMKYKFGSANPSKGGFDCSGAMYYVMRKAGYLPPRTSAQQYTWIRDAGNIHNISSRPNSLTDKAFSKLTPGDLLFWDGTYAPTDGRTVNITHVSMYLGKDQSGRHIMIGSSKGRSYKGKRGDGYGVYDLKLPKKESKARIVGYGPPHKLSGKKKTVPVADHFQKAQTTPANQPKYTPPVNHPNIVIIYGDDIGFGDVGAYGAKLIPTPNLDRLAKQSLQFTDAHCSASTCTPSRFSLLTGIHGFRHNVRVLPPNAPMKIKPRMFTLPQMLKKAGYKTAVIGKWHLGIGDRKTPMDWNGDIKPGPLEIGFDYSFILPSTNDRVPCVYVENHRVVNLDPKDPLYVSGKMPKGFTGTIYPDGKKDRSAMTYYQSTGGHNNSIINGIGRIGYMWGGKSALWNDETMADEFIKQTKKYLTAQNKDQPFFLHFCSQDIHVPRAPHPRFRGKSKLSYRGDAMVQFDWAAGEIIKTLDELGLAENTIVIFSSDNGPVYDDGYDDGTKVKKRIKEKDRIHDGSGPYRGGKYQIYEGGTRVPLLIRWPGKITPGVSTALVSQIDFIASFAKLVGVELTDTQGIDSRNTLPAFLGKETKGLPFLIEEARTLALRQGPWKFIKGRAKRPKSQLYNLDTDIGEQTNIMAQHPEQCKAMEELLEKMINDQKGIRNAVKNSDPQP